MRRDERLHESDLFFYTPLTDIAVFIMMQPAFMFKQCDVRFTHDPFWILFIPFFSCLKKQVKIKRIYLLSIFEMRLKAFNEIVPE